MLILFIVMATAAAPGQTGNHDCNKQFIFTKMVREKRKKIMQWCLFKEKETFLSILK